MGRKLWATNEALSSSDLNTYLANQVITVCTSGTRPTGIPEGHFIYETDTDVTYYYNGTSWVRVNPRIDTGTFTIALASGVASGTVNYATAFLNTPTVMLNCIAITGNTPVDLNLSSVGTSNFGYVCKHGTGATTFSGNINGYYLAVSKTG